MTVAVREKQEFIIAELDSEIRKIRLKLTDDVRSITIILEKSDDEWWYGSY
ncbi:hypothetical protein AB9F00_22210 [Escherichia coli]|uniref:hypothetical protein n=1 Tax=Escherichia coli TaxID=562 RepID=UPI0038B54488